MQEDIDSYVLAANLLGFAVTQVNILSVITPQRSQYDEFSHGAHQLGTSCSLTKTIRAVTASIIIKSSNANANHVAD